MLKAVVDTNIVFSAFLNSAGRIARPLISGQRFFRFYAPDYLHHELETHRPRIMRFSGLDDAEFMELHHLLLRNITIIDLSVIASDVINQAKGLCMDVDLDDFPFVALGLHLKAPLWTGDKRLMTGLSAAGQVSFITTGEIHDALIESEQKERHSALSKRKKR